MERIGFFGFALSRHQLATLLNKHLLKKLKICITHFSGFLLCHGLLLLLKLSHYAC